MNKDNILSEGFYTNLIKFFLPKKVKEQISYADFVKNAHQIELIVQTTKNILVGRKSISIDIYKGKRVKHGVFYG